MQYFSVLYFLLTVSLCKAVEAADRTSPPAGALVVSKTPSSTQYSNIQAAVDALSTTSTTPQSIFIYPGTYDEQVYIPRRAAQLTIYGSTNNTSSYTCNTVTITHGKSVDSEASDELTATVRARSVGLKVYNVNIVNTRGAGCPALALAAMADKQGYYGVKLQGYQDTLLANDGQQIYARSYIDGATDFIFGQRARAWFHKIDIRIKGRGWVTANGRDSSNNVSYYIFNKCNIKTASGVSLPAGSSYLGRPWRSWSRVLFQNTYMSAIINSAGWDIWAYDTPNTGNAYYREYGNTGLGSNGTRAAFADKLSAANPITVLFGTNYTSWADTRYLY